MARQTAGARIAEDAAALRGTFEASRYAGLAPMLRFERYFPRSAKRMMAQERRTGRGILLLGVLVGAVVAAVVLSLWRLSPFPLVYAVVAAIPALIVIRRMMDTLYGATSEAVRFVELLCFDRRDPIVYLRRFEGEDPPLPTLTSRNSVVGGAANAAGMDTLENLAQLLDAAGPVVGLGRPSATGFQHRIYRLFTPDEHWRDIVRHLLGSAKGVLMSYEATPIIDWELGEALSSNAAALFILVRGLPPGTVRDPVSALGALPAAVRALDRPVTFADKVSDKYPADEHGLLVVVARDAVRVYGTRMHFQQLWDLMFEEMVHKLKIAETRLFEAPAAYRPLVRALEGLSMQWNVVAAVAGAAALIAVWSYAG